MIATINGITVQGTPKELADYQVVMDQLRRDGVHIKPPLGKPTTSSDGGTTAPIDAGIRNAMKTNPSLHCEGPCYCTGACTRPREMSTLGKSLSLIERCEQSRRSYANEPLTVNNE